VFVRAVSLCGLCVCVCVWCVIFVCGCVCVCDVCVSVGVYAARVCVDLCVLFME